MTRSIYAIKSEAGPIKIGVSKNPKRRLESLILCQPFEAKLIHVEAVNDAHAVEAAAHELLRSFRRRGEWFDVSIEQAVAAIEEAIEYISSPRETAEVSDNEPWQRRAKLAGLNQKTLARLLGVAENTVSLQLRGKWQSGTPQYVKTVIYAWERLSPEDREALLRLVDDDAAK